MFKRGLNIWIYIFFYLFILLNNGYSFEDIHYKLDIRFIPPNIIEGKEKIYFTNDTAFHLNSLYLRVYPQRKISPQEVKKIHALSGYFKTEFLPSKFDASFLLVEDVKVNQRKVDFYYEDEKHTVLKLELPFKISAGDKVNISMKFRLKIPQRKGAFGYTKNNVRLYYWYPLLSVFKEGNWICPPYYLFHNPYFTEASLYEVRIKLPLEYNLSSSGKIESINLGKDFKEFFLKTNLPIRDFGMVIFKNLSSVKAEFNNIKINIYFPHKYKDDTSQVLEFVKDALEFYGRNFVEYPYEKLDVVFCPLGFGGIESSNLVMLDERVLDLPPPLKRYKEMLIVHEIGHQWFYNLVGANQFQEMFLVEGINCFCVFLYMKEKYGNDPQVLELKGILKSLIPNFSFFRASLERYLTLLYTGFDKPVVSSLESFRRPQNIFALNYSKAFEVMYMLSNLVGEEVLKEILREYLKKFCFKNAEIKDFCKIAQQISDNPYLEDFFNDWLYSKKFVDYEVIKHRNRYFLRNRGDAFVPFCIQIDNSLRKISSPRQLKKISFKQIKNIVIDPHFKIIEKDKVNNVYPRQITFTPVWIYLPFYEYSLFQDIYSYNVIFGPYIEKGIGTKVLLAKPYNFNLSFSDVYDFDGKQLGEINLHVKNTGIKNLNLTTGFLRRWDFKGEEELSGWHASIGYIFNPFLPSVFSIPSGWEVYLLHNTKPSEYKKRLLSLNRYYQYKETVVGFNLFLDTLRPYPFYKEGYRIFFNIEKAFRGWKSKRKYLRLQTGLRVNHSWNRWYTSSLKIQFGYSPQDFWLFSLGGKEGLRGYDLKSVKCSEYFLASVDNFFPLIKDVHYRLLGRYLHLDSLYLDVFFDIARPFKTTFQKSWYKCVGAGLDLELSLFSMVEKFILRLETSFPLKKHKRTPQFRVSFNFFF